MYSIKEIFYSLQGEGAQSGRPAVFCRFTGCNLWNGLARDKAASACPFCDTDFVGVNGHGGGKFPNAEILAETIKTYWPKTLSGKSKPYIVFTGGEPLLQLDASLINKMHQLGFEVAVETNGSIDVPENIDWICVSPKEKMQLKVIAGNELKLLYPQQLNPEDYQELNFDYFYLQAIDDENAKSNKQKTLDYCLSHPQWFYSIQLHKILAIE